MEYPGIILGIWQFNDNFIVLYNKDNCSIVKLNFKKEFNLGIISDIIQVLYCNTELIIIEIEKNLKIYKFGDKDTNLVLDKKLVGNQKFIDNKIFTVDESQILVEELNI